MRLRTFHAADMQTAMHQIRDELGDSAVIVSTTRDAKTKRVAVTAAIDQSEVKLVEDSPLAPLLNNNVSASAPLSAANVNAPQANLSRGQTIVNAMQKVLEYHSIPAELQQELLDTARMLDLPEETGDEALSKLMAKTLEAHFRFLPLPVSRAGFRLMLVGPTGAGKTTTLAKIAAQLCMDNQPVTAITFDTKRAGGIEQLRAFTDILNIPLETVESPQELESVLSHLPPEQIVLIDSFGCNPYTRGELRELGEFIAVPGIETVLTFAAGGDAHEAAEIAKAFKPSGAKRMLITRCDTTRRFGGALNAAHVGGYAFCNFSSSDRVAGEYSPLGSKSFSQLMLHYRIKN